MKKIEKYDMMWWWCDMMHWSSWTVKSETFLGRTTKVNGCVQKMQHLTFPWSLTSLDMPEKEVNFS